ncbi:MAG TPA: ribokinase [Prolixibacteraceae bacterium]|nr:ribokinase [Bacteroidales bacterium]HPV19628.1 ribokinase [Prolixibacteraceae bacterium]
MERPMIMVCGSSNTDMVVRTTHFPTPGETILGGAFLMNAGGKGANQAVAAARLGGDVIFAGKTGDDLFGQQATNLLREEGIDVGCMTVGPVIPSGVALITVNSAGENTIVVAPGANGTYSPEDFNRALPELQQCDFLLLQLEIPIRTVEYVARKARDMKTRVILNPAPAAPLSDELLKTLFLITPNETEASLLTGIQVTGEPSALKAASLFHEKGVENVIITLGAAGAFFLSEGKSGIIAAPRVTAVDTTAAGDTFNGALAVALAEGKSLEESILFANRAAAISVTRPGAQASIPFRNEVISSFFF